MKLCTLIGSLAAVFRADASALTSGPDSKVFVLEVDRDVESPFVCDAQLPAMFRVEREIVASLRASPYVTRNASEATWVLVAGLSRSSRSFTSTAQRRAKSQGRACGSTRSGRARSP